MRKMTNNKEEEERSLIKDLKRHVRLAVAWSQHGYLVPRPCFSKSTTSTTRKQLSATNKTCLQVRVNTKSKHHCSHNVNKTRPQSKMSARYYPETNYLVRAPPWKSLGMCRRMTNKGKSGFGKASDRVEAEEHRPSGFRWECGEVPSQRKGES